MHNKIATESQHAGSRGKGEDMASDATLMAAICAGDKLAYGQIVQRYSKRYLALAFRYVHNQASAEDIVQDCFIRLWTKPTSFNPDKARFTTWFHRVVVNKALDELRKKRPDALPEDYDAPDKGIPADVYLEEAEKETVLMQAVAQLPDRQKQALTLCYFEGCSNAEAADMMKVNVKALESLLTRARAKLKALVAKEQLKEQA